VIRQFTQSAAALQERIRQDQLDIDRLARQIAWERVKPSPRYTRCGSEPSSDKREQRVRLLILQDERVQIQRLQRQQVESAFAAQSQTSAIAAAAGTTSEPKIVTRIEPIYPPSMLTAGIEGSAVLLVTIGPDGHVVDIKSTNLKMCL